VSFVTSLRAPVGQTSAHLRQELQYDRLKDIIGVLAMKKPYSKDAGWMHLVSQTCTQRWQRLHLAMNSFSLLVPGGLRYVRVLSKAYNVRWLLHTATIPYFSKARLVSFILFTTILFNESVKYRAN
jgi:hypothetical protein